MNTSITQRVQEVAGRIARINEKVADLNKQSLALDSEIASLSNQGRKYKVLGDICTSLDQLKELGALELFWGSDTTGYDPEIQLKRVRNLVGEFEQKISVIEQARSALQSEAKQESSKLFLLNDQLAELQEVAENQQNEYLLVRTPNDIPYQPMVMPWANQNEDEKRYRKILLIIMLITIILGWLIPLLKRPVDKTQDVVIPDRIAQLVKKKQEPLPVEKPPEKTDRKDEKIPSKDTKVPVEAQKARAVAETKGVLAFKNNFADLIDDDSSSKLGAQAKISNSGKVAAGNAPQRSMIVAQATGDSGGINTSNLSRQGSGGGGQSITGAGVKFARVESATGAGVADDRPLSKGVGPSRTDEEIQIVFDRYKAALYRIYNRELRTDPTLRGKMVLRITIEPDGRVSACAVKSTDLASPALSAEVVDRVLKFNFGPKQGVPKLTIIYPIDFLPAS